MKTKGSRAAFNDPQLSEPGKEHGRDKVLERDKRLGRNARQRQTSCWTDRQMDGADVCDWG